MKNLAVIILIEEDNNTHTSHLLGDVNSDVYKIAKMFLDRIEELEEEVNGNKIKTD